jgi:two-component system, NtrC family, nitrogen regulation response regulator GlnG
MTAYSDLDSAVSAFQGGAFEYLPKPFDVNHALELIHRALEEGNRGDEAPGLDSGLVGQAMLGQAPAMQDVFRAIGRLSQSHATVLITGETGSGKELVAHALHRHSPRKDKPFIALNTAAIPKDLLGKRTVRPRTRRLHRRHRVAPRPLRTGRRRHAVPR